MDTEELVKLAASGNVRDVEEAWLSLLESDSPADQWKERAAVLQKLAEKDKMAEAEAMAATAIEYLPNSLESGAVLEVAGTFLLVLKDSASLHQAVAELYREVYADVPGLDALLDEAGVEGGRPPRRSS